MVRFAWSVSLRRAAWWLPMVLAVVATSAQAGPLCGGQVINGVARPTLGPPCTDSLIIDFGAIGDLETGASTVHQANPFRPDLSDTVNTSFNHNGISGGFINANSTWIDTFDVMGGTGTGTMTMDWSLDGALVSPVFPQTCASAGVGLAALTDAGTVQLDSATLISCIQGTTLPVADSGSFNVSFTYGVPFDLGLRLTGGTDSAFVSFLNTARFTDLVLPNGAVLQTGSGTVYPTGQTPVPEPTTVLLLGPGLAAVAVRGLKKRSKA